ncbi:MAG: hypothetical protein P8188_17995, partial [Gemmatimonadota bacterium]
PMDRSRHAASLVLLIASAGCASGSPPAPPVPVFRQAEEVPCEYEVMRTVEASTRQRFLSWEQHQRAEELLLGQAGSRIDADAVLAPDSEQQLLKAVDARSVPAHVDIYETTFEGKALRYVDTRCREAVAGG